MKIYKKLKPFISLVCAVLLIFSTIAFSVAAASTNSVTASTGATVKQGSIAYCYVYIDSVEGLAALDVTVHFDASKVKILNVYNSVSCTLYDSVTNMDNVQFSYIFDGKGATSKTRLFYFQYQALSNAEIGDSHFDITIGEAYDNSLNTVEVSGSRCNFKIAETVTSKTCSVSSKSSVASSIEKEFTLDYQFSTYQIASGTAVITYDPELFEVVSVTNGEFLSGKIADVNAELLGEIYISFVSTEYNTTKRNFISVTFRTIKNVTETSEIIFKAAELIDKDLNSISCNPYKTKVDLTFDKTYAGDAPSMKLDGTFSYDDMKITLVVSLEKDSRLGAGDFVIKFDPELVAYNSCTKGFSPTFFNINDKNVENGELKFHIISLSDIVTEETVLTVEFDVKNPYFCETADFTLEGTGITDSLTETVPLNFVDGSVWLEYQIKFLDYDGTLLQLGIYRYGDTVTEPAAPTRESDEYGVYTFSGWDKDVTPCMAETVYTATYDIEYTEYTVIFKNWDGTEISRTTYHYGDVVAVPDTPVKEKDSYYIYNFDGWDKEVVNCSGNAEYTAVFSAEHYHTYEKDITLPDCTNQGFTLYTCACGDTYESDYVDALGHDYKWITDKAENCGETGLKHEKCNRCGDVRNENTVIPATGNHSYTSEVTAQPSCTVDGVETFTCTVCGDTYSKSISATGHSYSSQTVLPDCANYGFTLYTCACGDTYTENVIPPNGHVLGDWVVSKDESGNFNGKIEAKCINCDFVCTEDSPEHQVVFIVDGEVYDAYNCMFGDTVTAPDNPVKEGYAFVGWTPAIPETMPNNEMTFTAVFEPIIYTATFVADGNTVDIIEFSVENQNVVAPSIPEKVGYNAVWGEYEVTLADFTVNAVYIPIVYTATFVADGKTIDAIEFTVENKNVVAPSIPEKVGYTAVWDEYEVTLADFTVNAVYTPIIYTATFMSDEKVIGTDTFTVEDSSLDYPYIVKRSYYDWIWDEHKIEAENLTIEGRYVPITYTITFVSSGKVIKTQEYNVDTVDSIVAPAKSLPAKQHYTTEWEDWTGKVGNITVNEIYVPIKYKISFYCQDRLIATRSYTIENSQSQIALPTPAKIDGYNAEWSKFKLEYKDQAVHAVYTPIVYTAQFVADGKVVATRTFTVETESLNEPPVPQKAGYYACWSGYTIGAKDITIVAKYHLPEVVAVSKRTMNVGDTFRILASCNFETTEKIWVSSDTSVATVNQHGEVTAVGKGKCEITTTCYGKDSLGNDIQASKTTIIIVNGNSESDNSKRSFRELFDEFFEVTLHDILYNLREFMLVLFRYAY